MRQLSSLTAIVVLTLTLVALTSATDIAATVARTAHVQNDNSRTLTFADRVAYQYAIEEVYWRHRIWPKENPGPKPSLDEVMSAAQVEKKVEDYLRDSQLLEDQWQRPITPEQLQAEMERMAKQTRNPEVLGELFEALGNDPAVIAECLGRQVLTQRLLAGLINRDKIEQLTALPADESAYSSVTTLGETIYSLPTISAVQCADDSWTATNAPDGREVHTAVWTGSEMIIWGGFDGSDLNSGSRYNPSTDSWTATSGTNVPSPRYGHTAIWTGSEMIVWGGYGYLNTGARYNPASDSWTSTSATNAPVARASHTAIWTGNEMIVWGGGSTGSSYLNTGGRYNPTMDSWTTTNTTNAPVGRAGQTGIWTGNEMIVWGGFNGNYLNSGGRYNPSTDSWTTMDASDAPDARVYHTAVWTGSEMVVWGGSGNGSDLNTGGRYIPASDAWIPTSTSGAPAARSDHSAVWTGSEMIVWGGSNNSGQRFNSGGRYNLSGWTATNTSSAPSARAQHTAIWTGSEMIVWGGFDGNSHLKTGGRYSPSAKQLGCY